MIVLPVMPVQAAIISSGLATGTPSIGSAMEPEQRSDTNVPDRVQNILSWPQSGGPSSRPMQSPPSTSDAAMSVLAPKPNPGPVKPRRLLGDWGGIRPVLEKVGITPKVAYVTMTVTNLRGGEDKVTRLSGQLLLSATIDMPKLLHVPGTFQATITRRHGESFNSESGLNLLINPQAINGRGEVWRVGQLWYQTTIGQVDLKIGRMQLSETFDMARCDFVNGFFCQGENVRIAPTSWPETPISQWGGRVTYKATPEITVKIGAFQYNPKNLDIERNLYTGFKGATGFMVPVEIAYAPKLAGRLQGNYAVGVWYLEADVDDPVLNTDGLIRRIYGGTPLRHGPQFGYYATARQQLIAANSDGSGAMSGFFNLSTFTNKTSRSHSAVALGLNYTGLIPGRPKDEVGLGIGRARINNRITEAIIASNAAGRPYAFVPTHEYAVEATYGVTVIPGLVVQPGFQFIVDPGGISERRNAILAELKTTVTF